MPQGCHSEEGESSLDLEGQEEEQLSDLNKSCLWWKTAVTGNCGLAERKPPFLLLPSDLLLVPPMGGIQLEA